MIDPEEFTRRQTELTAEFAKYVLENPDIDAALPEDSYIYFQVDGQPEFNQYSQELAERREREDEMVAVCVHVKGLAPPQGSRLVEPQIILQFECSVIRMPPESRTHAGMPSALTFPRGRVISVSPHG